MCSINGILDFNGTDERYLKETARAMSDTMMHRGPDEHGLFSDNFIGLGHNRLSIIDLCSGQQPMFNEDASCVIVFNGEIYNFKTLKSELTDAGHTFSTNSDTETILHGYEEWGENVSMHLNGMFAFAVWDRKKKKLTVSRDRIGEKPLYYGFIEDRFVFASELKAIQVLMTQDHRISKESVTSFFSYKFIPAPMTIYEDIYKLSPGCNLTIGMDKKIDVSAYWNPADSFLNSNPNVLTYEEYKYLVRESVVRAVKRQMISDVPMGTFLSGGIDSSIITAVMAQNSNTPVRTFTIGFKNKAYDESAKAKVISDMYATDHTSVELDYSHVAGDLGHILAGYDEPFADSSSVPTYYVSKLASKKVKTVLTGDGGDEVFAGYDAYVKFQLLNAMKNYPEALKGLLSGLFSKAAKITKKGSLIGFSRRVAMLSRLSEGELWASGRISFFDTDQRQLFLEPSEHNPAYEQTKATYDELDSPVVNRMLYSDQRVCLQGDMLAKVDRAAMMNSLETRAPFLDFELIELANGIPVEYKISGKNKKRILKDAFARELPVEILNQKKAGFGVPVGDWLRNELKEELLSLTSAGYITRQGIFDVRAVEGLVKGFLENDGYYTTEMSKLWNLFVFQHWYSGRNV
jgi:asparagine synthase (glutamine-hydrolysing)